MIAYIEVPPEATRIDETLKALAADITKNCAAIGKTERLDNNTDLFASVPSGWIFIRNGVFKYYFGKRLIRLYSTGDLIPVTPDLHEYGCTCNSEFGAEITIFETAALGHYLEKDPRTAEQLIEYHIMHATMMHILCAAFMTEELQPDLSLRSYQPGEIIIAQGDPAHEIYQMIQGDAIVTVDETEVGSVASGEVFGEISFFTDGTRSATVTAKTECMVQVMGKDEFITLVKLKPSVNLAISKTLSHRIVETNRKITDHTD
ncbi:MAG: cyclic nucleotide-binding domain-containing protein [Chitinispirillaceae bacterium]|nr:cyclic nucleotide-binding domain-containing protein [Chitinispirillaceae bacterium]